ncbi:MAG: LacI family DNA-binding transcriptional regulator [Lautropia sp.]
MARPSAPATSLDVARAAGVNQSTVSRSFTPGASVADATRERVLAAARRLGYRPNAIARSLITRRSRMIAMVVSYLDNQFYPRVIERMSQRLQQDGYHLLLFVSDSDRADTLLERLLQYQVDGLVLVSVRLSSALARDCARAGIPVVLFNRVDAARSAGSVASDNVAGGRLAARRLIDGGHRRIAFLAGLEDSSTSRDRERGFLDEMRAAARTARAGSAARRGRAPQPAPEFAGRAVGHFRFDGARTATLALFADARRDRPDAVFVANDHMAIAALDTLRHEIGLRVPQDVSVIGFDDVPQAGWPSYRLTTIEQAADPMVEATVRMLLARIEDPSLAAQRVVVPVRLVERDTVRPRR